MIFEPPCPVRHVSDCSFTCFAFSSAIASSMSSTSKQMWNSPVPLRLIQSVTPEIARNMGYHRELEVAIESLKKMHKRGIRILPGGDYGFAWIKHGTNAKDLEYFVKYLGFSPMEALVAATILIAAALLLLRAG